MTDSDGNLSVDFLVGFTIFMVAFIWVATLVPNLFLGVSAFGIDYDAVAYRTGVILAEDPGTSIDGSPWEGQPDTAKGSIERFGLAISKETPNVLSEVKVNRFFNKSAGFIYPDDYRKKAIFGDYPYRFNISLEEVGDVPKYVGEAKPENYGYIRRDVRIKHYSNATIDLSDYKDFQLFNKDKSSAIRDGNASFHDFAIVINRTQLIHGNITTPLINPNYDAAYRIDPRSDWINITVDDIDQLKDKTKVPGNSWLAITPFVNVTKIRLSYTLDDSSIPITMPTGPYAHYIYKDGDLITPVTPPFELERNVTFIFKPGYFQDLPDTGSIYINITFGVNTTDPGNPSNKDFGIHFINTSQAQPWNYSYNGTYVTQPSLTNAVLEVAVW